MTQKQIDDLSIQQRIEARTPKFFQKLKLVGLSLVAISGVLLAAPVSLPAIVTTIAGYLAVGGAVASAVSQVTVEANQ